MKNLVIGIGEVGTAIKAILGCDAHDPAKNVLASGEYDIIHICFPYRDNFVELVDKYRGEFKAKHVVIHSTVPVHTSKVCNAVHSPVRGVHPHLERSVRIFVKYFGGKDAEIVAKEFDDKGIRCVVHENSDATELMKLVDTSLYGMNVLMEKEIHRLCKQFGVDHNLVYTHANQTYNEGYSWLGMPQFLKYNIKHMDGSIGGHCIMPNAELLDSWMNDVLKEKNDLYA